MSINFLKIFTQLMTILALLIKKCLYDEKMSYYKYLGYFIGGPFIFAIANFLVDEMQKRGLRDIFFIARDGFLVKKVFESILSVKKINDIKTSYIVANRSLNLLINLDLEKLNLNDNQKKIQSLFYLLCEQDENFKDTYSYMKLDNKEQYNILLENKDLLENISHLNKKFYKKYLQNFDFSSDNIAIFDGNASTFSSLRLLKSMLKNKNIFAFYYNVGGDEKTRKSFPFCAYEGAVKILNYPFSEFLMSANHYSKTYMKGENDFAENDDDFESSYKELFSLIQRHEEDFVKDMLDTFSNFKLEFDSEMIASYINFFLLNLSLNDSFHLKNLYIGIDPTHSLHSQIIKYNQVMHKPLYGSIKRTKEHLSYKLGEILLCPFRLIKAFIIFKKNKNKKLPPLYLYKDYNESIKIKKTTYL